MELSAILHLLLFENILVATVTVLLIAALLAKGAEIASVIATLLYKAGIYVLGAWIIFMLLQLVGLRFV